MSFILFKSLLDQNSTIVALKQSLKTHKNLVKNLQTSVREKENESSLKTKEIVFQRQKIHEIEKKMQVCHFIALNFVYFSL
jgi:chromosome segregation ATPase